MGIFNPADASCLKTFYIYLDFDDVENHKARFFHKAAREFEVVCRWYDTLQMKNLLILKNQKERKKERKKRTNIKYFWVTQQENTTRKDEARW